MTTESKDVLICGGLYRGFESIMPCSKPGEIVELPFETQDGRKAIEPAVLCESCKKLYFLNIDAYPGLLSPVTKHGPNRLAEEPCPATSP